MATDTVAAPSRPTHYWQLPMFLAGVAAVGLATAKFPVAPDTPAARFGRNLKSLQAALDARPLDPAALENLAATVAGDPAADAPAKFAAGSALLAIAEQAAPADDGTWKRAGVQLAAVAAAALPDAEDRKRLAFRKAKADAATGVGDPMLLALTLAEVPPGEPVEGERRRLLAESLVRQSPPQLKAAATELQAYLSSSQRLGPVAAAKTRQRLADVYEKLNDPDKARDCLKDLGPNAPADVRAMASAKLGSLAAAENDFTTAARNFDAALASRELPAELRPELLLQAAANKRRANTPAEAVPYLQEAIKAGGATARTAGVGLAEVLLRDPAGRGKRAPAVDALLTAVTAPESAATKPESVRAAFEEAIRTCLGEKDYATAVRAATAYLPLAEPGRAAELRAEANNAWGESLQAVKGQADAAKEKLRAAAADFATLSKAAADTTGQADWLKRAARAFRGAGEDSAAAALVDQLTKTTGAPDDVIAAAWVEKADGLLAGHQFQAGADALRQAMALPTPAAATARVRLAIANLDEARVRTKAAATDAARQEAAAMAQSGRDLLAAAIKAPTESPAERAAHELALFELGKLHLNKLDLSEAEARFRQLLQAHPGGAQTGNAKLYLASCLLLNARGDHQGGRAPADADAKLAESRKLFEELSNSDDLFLRTQADIRLANTTLLLRKYDDMPALCAKLTKRYEGKVEELIIQSMLYTAYHFADRVEPAAAVRGKMRELFDKLPDSAFPGGADEYTREYWQREWFTPLKTGK